MLNYPGKRRINIHIIGLVLLVLNIDLYFAAHSGNIRIVIQIAAAENMDTGSVLITDDGDAGVAAVDLHGIVGSKLHNFTPYVSAADYQPIMAPLLGKGGSQKPNSESKKQSAHGHEDQSYGKGIRIGTTKMQHETDDQKYRAYKTENTSHDQWGAQIPRSLCFHKA